MAQSEPFSENCFYHIYCKGTQGTNIFREPKNYEFLLSLYTKYVTDSVDLYAYCLLRNHLHLLVRVKPVSNSDTDQPKDFSHAINNMLNTYVKSYNSVYHTSGGLFMRPFGRRVVPSESYLTRVIYYIHHNPEKHSFTTEFTRWPYSSYHELISSQPTILNREDTFALFGGRQAFIEFHNSKVEYSMLNAVFGVTMG